MITDQYASTAEKHADFPVLEQRVDQQLLMYVFHRRVATPLGSPGRVYAVCLLIYVSPDPVPTFVAHKVLALG